MASKLSMVLGAAQSTLSRRLFNFGPKCVELLVPLSCLTEGKCGHSLCPVLHAGTSRRTTVLTKYSGCLSFGVSYSQQAPEITAKDIQLAQDMWKTYVIPNAEAVGVVVFKNLFAEKPEYTKYFEGMKESPDQDLFETPRFKRHMVKKVLAALTQLVNTLDQPDKLTAKLKDIAGKHKRFELQREHFETLHKVILMTFAQALPEQFTKEAEASWDKILGVAMDGIATNLESLYK